METRDGEMKQRTRTAAGWWNRPFVHQSSMGPSSDEQRAGCRPSRATSLRGGSTEFAERRRAEAAPRRSRPEKASAIWDLRCDPMGLCTAQTKEMRLTRLDSSSDLLSHLQATYRCDHTYLPTIIIVYVLTLIALATGRMDSVQPGLPSAVRHNVHALAANTPRLATSSRFP